MVGPPVVVPVVTSSPVVGTGVVSGPPVVTGNEVMPGPVLPSVVPPLLSPHALKSDNGNGSRHRWVRVKRGIRAL